MQVSRFLLLPLLVAFMACDSDDTRNTEVPSLVLNSFKIKYPQATDISWQRSSEGHEVDFEVGKIDHSLLLNDRGEIIQQKQEISLNEVPEKVLSSLRKNFEQKDLEDPERLLIGTATYYQLEIDQALLDQKVVLDEDGKMSKNIPYWE